jgi:hypothetical protein
MGNKTIGDLRAPAKFAGKEGVQPGEFKEGVLYRSLGGLGFHKLGKKWHMQQETATHVKHRELPHTDESLHQAHGPLYKSGTPTQEGPKGGKFADGDGPAERDASVRKTRSVQLARLSHEEAAGHLDKARANHELAAKHLAAGNHQLAKDHWAKAKEHLTAAKYSHTELGRHHESFKALEAGLAAMFKDESTHHVTKDEGGVKVGTALHGQATEGPKGNSAAELDEHLKQKHGNGGKFASAESEAILRHRVLRLHGYKYEGDNSTGAAVYSHPSGAIAHDYQGKTSVHHAPHSSKHATASSLNAALHKLHPREAEKFGAKQFEARGPVPMTSGRMRSVSDLGASFGVKGGTRQNVLQRHGYSYSHTYDGPEGSGIQIWHHQKSGRQYNLHPGGHRADFYRDGKSKAIHSREDFDSHVAKQHGAAKHADEPEGGAKMASGAIDYWSAPLKAHGYKKTYSSGRSSVWAHDDGHTASVSGHSGRVEHASGKAEHGSEVIWHPRDLHSRLSKVHGSKHSDEPEGGANFYDGYKHPHHDTLTSYGFHHVGQGEYIRGQGGDTNVRVSKGGATEIRASGGRKYAARTIGHLKTALRELGHGSKK